MHNTSFKRIQPKKKTLQSRAKIRRAVKTNSVQLAASQTTESSHKVPAKTNWKLNGFSDFAQKYGQIKKKLCTIKNNYKFIKAVMQIASV